VTVRGPKGATVAPLLATWPTYFTRLVRRGLTSPSPCLRGSPGLEIKTTLRGDFEITAGYELLRADQPKEGYGVGFELFVHPSEAPQARGEEK
jgi:hypothetical protein